MPCFQIFHLFLNLFKLVLRVVWRPQNVRIPHYSVAYKVIQLTFGIFGLILLFYFLKVTVPIKLMLGGTSGATAQARLYKLGLSSIMGTDLVDNC